jgi:hypothetical protein
MAQDDDKRLGEILETARKYKGEQFWEDYLGNHFARLSMSGRAEELAKWDDLLQAETGLTREHADLVQRKRQLEDIHFGMLKVSR